MAEWLDMGGNAFFVWSSFALGALTVAWNLWSARRKEREAFDLAREVRDDASAS